MTEKNKGKKLLTWTLALSMTLALPPVGVFAEDGAGGEGSQQTNIASATEQPDGSSNGSGTANNEGNKLASTSEEGGQTNDPAPSLGTTGAPASSGEEKKGENETLTPLPTPVSGGEAEEGKDNTTPSEGKDENKDESKGETTGEVVTYAATIDGKEGTYETLQAAIDAAENGETVVLAKDVTENININKSITLDLKGKTLTGFGDDSVVTITGAETNVTITSSAEEKGKITGGNNLSNGGGFSIQDATVNLHNLSITENKAIGIGGAGSECTGGGGIYAKDANLTLDNVHVYENTADLEEHEAADGGGILSIGGALTIKNNSVIENNTAIDDGGGICASNTLVNIEASVIQDNHSLYGGGLYVTGKNSCTITQNTRIQNNRAEYMTSKQKETEFMVPIGGGIYCGDGLDLTIQNSTVALNIGGDQGGGIVAYSMGELTLDHAEITDNNASFGGGIFALCTAAANTHITLQNGSSINKNEAANGAGIAICNLLETKNNAILTIKSGSELYGNKATNGYGGGIYSQSATITIGENTTNSDSNGGESITNNNSASICNNQASYGGGIYGVTSNIILAEDNALYNNAAQTAGDDLFTFGANSMISLADATKMSGDRKLASDGEKITGWFYDGYKDGRCSRWGAETEDGQKYFDAYVTDETAPTQFGLKAAHEQLYKVTVHYAYSDGTKAAEAAVINVKAGAAYSIDSPAIEGYKADKATVSGTIPADKPADTVITVTYTKESSGGGGGGSSSVTKYAVTISSADNGKVTSDKTRAAKDSVVTITTKANDGYVLDTIKATDKAGKEIKLTDKGDGKYTFTMPASKVEVKAAFKQTASKPGKPAEEMKTVVVMQIGSKTMFVNGKAYEKDAAPVIMNDRTLVPIRFVTESLGGKVAWNAETKEVTLVIDGKEIKMTIGKTIEKYGVAPVIINGRTFVPVRFVADELGATTAWNAETKTVTITKAVTPVKTEK